MKFHGARAAAALFLTFAPALFAIDISTLKPTGYVNDFASVVDAASKAELESYAKRVETATGVQMAFVTLQSLDGEPLEDFANDLYRRWGIGQKGKDEGLLLLLVVADRRSRLEIGRGLEEFIPDGMAGMLLRDMREALRGQRYGEALLIAGHSLGDRISKAKNVSIPAAGPMRRRPPPQATGPGIPWPFLIGIFVLFWLLSGAARSRRRGYRSGLDGFLPGVILGSTMGRSSRGGYGGGGFGGYDSGGGFGGFGGGDSGGGGASGDW